MSTPLAQVKPLFSVDIPVGHKSGTIIVLPNNELRLYVEKCLRKRCCADKSSEILYVSSNIELYWEEHRYIEARYDCVQHTLNVKVNQQTVFDQKIV